MTAVQEPRAGASRPRLGRYELVTRIAAGGMAEVYVGRVRGEGGFERLVAIKRMLPNIAEDERFAEMFLDEGRISGHIESPHVVQILDVGRDPDGTLFIAMELVRGAALHRLLSAVARAGERVPAPIAAAIVVQAAEGLAAAHEAATPLGESLHIVHRDVSPQNVLCGIDGRVRVADFGIARAVHRRSNTSTGELKGKLAYFAPEQLRAQPADARSDVFALGVVAWETFAQRRLFQGEHPLATMERIRAYEPEPLDVLRTDVPVGASVAIARALAKDPERRTGTARALADELRAATPVADAAALAAFVRRFAHDEVKALDDRVKAALSGAQTIAMPMPPVMEPADTSGIVPSGHAESTQALDAPTLVTPSASFPVPGGAPRVPPPPPPRPSPAEAVSRPAEVHSETSMSFGATDGSSPGDGARRWVIFGTVGAAALLLLVVLAAWLGGGPAGPVATELPLGGVTGTLPAYVPSASAPPPPAAASVPSAVPPAATPAGEPSAGAPVATDTDTASEETAGARRARGARTRPGTPSGGTGATGAARADRDDDEPRTAPSPARGAEPEPRRGGLRGRDSFLGDLGN